MSVQTIEVTEQLERLKRQFERAETGEQIAELCRQEAELLGFPEDRPCDWEKMSGVCMVCGAGPDEECEVEREERRASCN